MRAPTTCALVAVLLAGGSAGHAQPPGQSDPPGQPEPPPGQPYPPGQPHPPGQPYPPPGMVYPPPILYGDAGCGLGSMIFGPEPGFSQVFAATTNGLFYSQTFGITSGTSNCLDVVPGYASAQSFSAANRTVLAKDIARGRGETIATLSTLGGCRDTAAVGAHLQRNFRRIAPDAQVSDRVFGRNVVAVLSAERSLGCAKLVPVAAR